MSSFYREENGVGAVDYLLLTGFIAFGTLMLVLSYSVMTQSTSENLDSVALETATSVDAMVQAELIKAGLVEEATLNESNGNENWTCKKKGVIQEGLTSKEATNLKKEGWDCSPD